METTVFNFYFAEKEGRKQQDTHKLFKAIEMGKYQAYTSKYVHDEIIKDTSSKFLKMNDLIDKYVKNIINYDQQAMDLANIYIENSIIPAKYIWDANHIAIATINKLDFLVSYNMSHIIKLKTMIGTGFINLHHDYQLIGLCTPSEVIYYGQN